MRGNWPGKSDRGHDDDSDWATMEATRRTNNQGRIKVRDGPDLQVARRCRAASKDVGVAAAAVCAIVVERNNHSKKTTGLDVRSQKSGRLTQERGKITRRNARYGTLSSKQTRSDGAKMVKNDR